jgi:hypothetical protein
MGSKLTDDTSGRQCWDNAILVSPPPSAGEWVSEDIPCEASAQIPPKSVYSDYPRYVEHLDGPLDYHWQALKHWNLSRDDAVFVMTDSDPVLPTKDMFSSSTIKGEEQSERFQARVHTMNSYCERISSKLNDASQPRRAPPV